MLKVIKPQGDQVLTLGDLWAQAQELGWCRIWQNEYTRGIHVEIHFKIGQSKVEARSGDHRLLEDALMEAIQAARKISDRGNQ